MSKRQLICPETWRGHASRVTYAPAVKKGNMIFLSGVTANERETGGFVGEGDIIAQTRQIFRNIREILAEAGATMDDVVMTTDYFTTLEGYRGTADIRREYFGDSFPAATGVQVVRLVNPKALIEIDVIAVMDD